MQNNTTSARNTDDLFLNPASSSFSKELSDAPQGSVFLLEQEEEDQEFPEDYDDFFPRGFVDTKDAGVITIKEKREDTRGRLAVLYTAATFMMFVLGFVVSIIDSLLRDTSIVENLVTLLPMISGIFLGSLGFVLGYYFRKSEDAEK